MPGCRDTTKQSNWMSEFGTKQKWALLALNVRNLTQQRTQCLGGRFVRSGINRDTTLNALFLKFRKPHERLGIQFGIQ